MAAPKKAAAKAVEPASQTGLVGTPAAKGGAKLNRSQPFGEVTGQSGARYEQNGKLYDVHENECDLDGNPVKAKAEKVTEPVAEVVTEVVTDEPAAETTANVANEDELAALAGGK